MLIVAKWLDSLRKLIRIDPAIIEFCNIVSNTFHMRPDGGFISPCGLSHHYGEHECEQDSSLRV